MSQNRSNNIMDQLDQLENDQHRLEEIQQLERILRDAKQKYVSDYNNISEHVVEPVIEKLKQNTRIKQVVDNYLQSYVKDESYEQAEKELYQIMAAEFLEMLETLNHTSCSVM